MVEIGRGYRAAAPCISARMGIQQYSPCSSPPWLAGKSRGLFFCLKALGHFYLAGAPDPAALGRRFGLHQVHPRPSNTGVQITREGYLVFAAWVLASLSLKGIRKVMISSRITALVCKTL